MRHCIVKTMLFATENKNAPVVIVPIQYSKEI